MMPAHILFLHSPDIPGHCKPGIHILYLNYQQGTEGADRAQLLGQAQWLVLAHHVPQKISARFSRAGKHFRAATILVCNKMGKGFSLQDRKYHFPVSLLAGTQSKAFGFERPSLLCERPSR